MEVDIGARVISSDRQNVGKVNKVVIDPRTNELLDLVVHRHEGLLTVRDIVVPMGAVERAKKDEVALRLTGAAVDELPDFVETRYQPVPRDWFAPAPYPPGGLLWPAGFAASAFTEEERSNVPPGTVTLREGAEVACPDGRIGVVDEVITAPQSDHVLGFVVRQGTLFTHDVFIPIDWVAAVRPDEVLLNRTKAEVQHLAERAA